MKKILLLTSFIILNIFVSSNSFAQCAMCKATVENGLQNGTSKIGSGLNTGILYLMVIPYILFGVIGFYWYKSSKKEKFQRDRIESVLKGKLTNG